MTILTDVNQLYVGEVVDLYELDMNPLGYSDVLYMTPSEKLGGVIVYGGHAYVARAIVMGGFERSSQSQPPEPTLTLANVDKGGNALLLTYENLIGAKVTRRRTLSKYLDNLPDGSPNPLASWADQFIPEIWYIEQKSEDNRQYVQWRLKSVLDLEGREIPRRRILKSFCERVYRVQDPNLPGTFKYPLRNACPYAGAQSWDRWGIPTSMTYDECDKTHKGCALRFPTEGLPIWAFPGADRLPRG
jgi:lambda family phage minor tail protein L